MNAQKDIGQPEQYRDINISRLKKLNDRQE